MGASMSQANQRRVHGGVDYSQSVRCMRSAEPDWKIGVHNANWLPAHHHKYKIQVVAGRKTIATVKENVRSPSWPSVCTCTAASAQRVIRLIDRDSYGCLSVCSGQSGTAGSSFSVREGLRERIRTDGMRRVLSGNPAMRLFGHESPWAIRPHQEHSSHIRHY